jgi:UDP-hydrolysing UDP-N-acetyl-D-glucosamine 2-epimerase
LNKIKICIVINNRANYARIKSVIENLKKKKKVDLKIILGASAILEKFGKLEKTLSNDKIKIHHKINSIIEGETPLTMAKSTGLAVIEISSIFADLKPDVVVTIADRFETMATAVAASYMNIILAHTQGGEITGSIDESVRHAITKLSHIHFASSKIAYKNIIQLGEDKKNVFLTGCPSLDLAKKFPKKIDDNLLKKYNGVGKKFNLKEKYIVVMQHPVTTEYGDGFKQINETIKAVSKLNFPTIWLWPNVDAGSDEVSKGLRIYREKNIDSKIFFIKNFTAEDYLSVIYNCSCLIGNSSSAIREGGFLGVPAVNIGTRQTGREVGKNIINVDYDEKKILKAIDKQLRRNKKFASSKIYGDGNAGKYIASILSNLNIKNVSIQKKLSFKKIK